MMDEPDGKLFSYVICHGQPFVLEYKGLARQAVCRLGGPVTLTCQAKTKCSATLHVFVGQRGWGFYCESYCKVTVYYIVKVIVYYIVKVILLKLQGIIL